MVGEASYNRGKCGRKKVGRTIDDWTKDVVPYRFYFFRIGRSIILHSDSKQDIVLWFWNCTVTTVIQINFYLC